MQHCQRCLQVYISLASKSSQVRNPRIWPFSPTNNIFVQCPHEAAMVGMLHHITRKWLFLDAVKLDVFLLPLCHTQTEKISLTLLLDPL